MATSSCSPSRQEPVATSGSFAWIPRDAGPSLRVDTHTVMLLDYYYYPPMSFEQSATQQRTLPLRFELPAGAGYAPCGPAAALEQSQAVAGFMQ